jgi:hypothetical protein
MPPGLTIPPGTEVTWQAKQPPAQGRQLVGTGWQVADPAAPAHVDALQICVPVSPGTAPQ